jgi:hypothetical protein
MTTPATWSTWSWHRKAWYLVEKHRARDFSEACSLLGRAHKPKQPKPKAVEPVPVRLPYAD